MKFIHNKDILNSTCQTIINPINCVGVMGAGLALSIKKKYPLINKDYKEKCKKKQVKMCIPYVYKINEKKQILLFPTKRHWKDKSKKCDIDYGIRYMIENKNKLNISSLAVCGLGCGLGGLDLNEIKPIVMKLDELNIDIEVYLPK